MYTYKFEADLKSKVSISKNPTIKFEVDASNGNQAIRKARAVLGNPLGQTTWWELSLVGVTPHKDKN